MIEKVAKLGKFMSPKSFLPFFLFSVFLIQKLFLEINPKPEQYVKYIPRCSSLYFEYCFSYFNNTVENKFFSCDWRRKMMYCCLPRMTSSIDKGSAVEILNFPLEFWEQCPLLTYLYSPHGSIFWDVLSSLFRCKFVSKKRHLAGIILWKVTNGQEKYSNPRFVWFLYHFYALLKYACGNPSGVDREK